MNSLSNSESALDKFAKKIDFANLTGNPADFYKTGLAFVENSQFDDGIIEFVKIIKTVSHEDVLFVNAVKELTSMGFSDDDISAISGSPEAVKDIVINHFLTPSTPAASKNNTPLAGAMIVTIIIIIFGCLSIVSDTSPEAYERNGNLVMAAMVFGMALFIPLIILIFLIVISTVFKSDSKIKLQEKINNTPPAIAKNDKNPDVADLTVGNLTTQELSNTSSNEKKSKKEDQIDLLPIAVIGGIVLIITLLMSLPYLLSYL